MSTPHLTAIADRKALLATRAELDRTRMSLAIHEIRTIIRPAPDAARTAAVRPTAAMIISLAAPLFGTARLARWVRFASLALAAYRIARSWRTPA